MSDDVKGLVSAEDTVRDPETLLRVAEVEPPYVLLGAAFGGLLSTSTRRPTPTR